MENDNQILDLAIHYTLNNSLNVTEELTKHQKRAVRKQAATLLVEEGEVNYYSNEFLHNGHDNWLTITM